MEDLAQIRDSYIADGLNYEQAQARTAQDAMLDLIAKSELARNVTIKGGVLIQHISHDARRATIDFDLDFIRFSIADNSIREFVKSLTNGSSPFSIKLIGEIEQLRHQDYSGKRIHVVISDNQGNSIKTKVDIGVHNLISPALTEICFDLKKLDDAVTILGDSNEQVVAEKLRSLLRIGTASTRYKDVFDIYYFLCIKGVRQQELNEAIRTLILKDSSMRENDFSAIAKRLSRILNDRRFKKELTRAKNNWLHVSPDKVVSSIIAVFS